MRALKLDGIDTRNYFSPPIHQQQSYRADWPHELPVTDRTASQVVSLPMFRDLSEGDRKLRFGN